MALSSRFIQKSISLLNTQVAKNWSRFDSFLELLEHFAEDDTGLEFFFKQHFIEKACDFLLGRKSPLSSPSEKRYEMGGSFTSPNFTPLIRLITKMIANEQLMNTYPLTEVEKKMFLHPDLLKVMLGSA